MRRIIFALIICVFVVTVPPHLFVNADGEALRRYPVIPVIRGGVASQARAIVLRGKKLGNRLNVFAKIGDSNTAFLYFLTGIGTGSYQLGAYADLQDTVNFFSSEVARTNNSFADESIAAVPGWTSDDLLNPAKAMPNVCAPGENSVECELRVVRPSVALIMIGTNDLAISDVKTFSANLERIVSICEKRGVIPIISTLPYRFDPDIATPKTEPFNLAIVKIAQRHSAPLWNYWLAIESLAEHGISNDKIHMSVPADQSTTIFDDEHLKSGFTVRNLNALQILNALRPILR